MSKNPVVDELMQLAALGDVSLDITSHDGEKAFKVKLRHRNGAAYQKTLRRGDHEIRQALLDLAEATILEVAIDVKRATQS